MGSRPCCQVPVHSLESGWTLSAGGLPIVSGSLYLLFARLTSLECGGSRLGRCASCFLGMGSWLGDAWVLPGALGLFPTAAWVRQGVVPATPSYIQCQTSCFFPAIRVPSWPISDVLLLHLLRGFVVVILVSASPPLFPLSPSPTYLFLLVTSCPSVWSGSTPSAV